MSLTYLLDTNIISEPLRPRPNETVLAHLQQHQAVIAISTIVWHEMLFGCYRLPPSAKRETIEDYLFNVISATLSILPYDFPAAQWHAAERARLTGLGKTPPFVDGQIAATAAVNDLILVTANEAHFSVFEGLQVINWQIVL